MADSTLLEVDDSLAGFMDMDSSQRQSYAKQLHDDLQAEKAAEKAHQEQAPVTRPSPGRTRDESGRHKKPDDTSAQGEETPAARDAAAPAKPASGKEAVDDWRSADVKDLAAAYGLDDEELAAMPSREVLDATLKVFDKRFAADKNGQAKLAEPAAAQQSGQTTAEDIIAKLEKIKLGEVLVSEDAATIQEFIAGSVSKMKQLDDRFSNFEKSQTQSQQQTARQNIRTRLVSVVQSFGHTDLYGEAGKAPTKEQEANIEAVFQDHLERGLALEKRGGRPSPTLELVKRSIYALHGEKIVESEKQQQLKRFQKSGARRTGGGTTKPVVKAGATGLEKALAAADENWRLAHGKVG